MYDKDSLNRYFNYFSQNINQARLMSRLTTLSALERPQTAPAQQKAAEYTFSLLKEDNFSKVELLKFPADGKTVYQDKIMPLLWDVSKAVLSSANNDEVYASYESNPFSIIAGSTATPKDGIYTKIITETQLLSGEDATNSLVLLSSNTRPCNTVLRPLLDLGAIGFVSDYLVGRYQTPDDCQWVNGCSDAGDWHVTLEDRDFIGFSVSPKVGAKLRAQAEKGNCNVHVFCDGKRYSGEQAVVTGVIPGKHDKEFWVVSHLYEPLLNDNSTGVVAAIEIARLIQETLKQEYTIRVIFAHELYGFAAYATYRGNFLGNQVVGGCNLDDLSSCRPGKLLLVPSGEAVPFHGNEILKYTFNALKDTVEGLELETIGQYYDDLALGDSTIGVPLTWLMGKGSLWHNSAQCNLDYIDEKIFFRTVAFAATYILACADTLAETVKITRLKPAEEKHSAIRDYASRIVFARNSYGFPFSMAKIPVRKRPVLPDGMLYGPFANVLANMDGKKDMAQIILETEGERQKELSDQQIMQYLNRLNVLEKYGYLTAVKRPTILEDEIIEALKKLQITSSDVLLVHASTTKCGFISGGAKTIVEAIRKTAGTALFTTFTNPYIYLGGPYKVWNYSPFDKDNIQSVWTGGAGKYLLERVSDAIRSKHITHSWTGFGPLASFCLDAHGPTEPPCGENSPIAKALELNGKILYFGTGLAPSTFLHYLEDQLRLPYLESAICKVKEANNLLKTVLIERHLPGHREFYTNNAHNGKFFTKAVAAGLEIKSVSLGISQLQVIDLNQFYKIGIKLLKEEPDLLLCDSPKCSFCSKYRCKR